MCDPANSRHASRACLVSLGDRFVLTGGYGSCSTVSLYSDSGHVRDLAPLNTARRSHGCAVYTDTSQRQVRVVMASPQWSKPNMHCIRAYYLLC